MNKSQVKNTGSKQQNQEVFKIKVTPLKRTIMIILIALQYIWFFYFISKVIHYIGYPLNLLYQTPTLFTQFHNNNQTHYIHNIILYTVFFLQHYIMAAFWFKNFMVSIYKQYPFYQRYIYNILSGITYVAVINNLKPTYQLVFQGWFYSQIVIILLGFSMLFQANKKLGSMLMFPIHRKKVLNDQQLQLEKYSSKRELKLITTGAYGWCRHPMQTGVLVLLLFASRYYTIERLIFIGVHFVGIIIGVILQQKRNVFKFKNYESYQKQVPYMFIKGLI